MDAIVDAHVHLQLEGWPQMGQDPHPLTAYLGQLDTHDIARFGVLAMAGQDDLDLMRQRNDELLELTRAEPRAYAMCSVHPYDGEPALAELERVAGAGARGIKLHPNTQGLDVGDPRVRAVVAKAGDLGLPVLFDSVSADDPGQPEKFMTLAMHCAQTQIVLAHSFGPKFTQAVMFAVLARYPSYGHNVWLELSAIGCMFAHSPYADQLAWVLRNHGLDRVLWGSDYPLFSMDEAVGALASYGFDDDELRLITHDNAAGLLGLDG